MATNPNNPHSFQFERMLAGGVVTLKRYVTLTGATLAVGDPVVLAAGVKGVRGIKLAGATSTLLFGMAMEAVTGVATYEKSVLVMPFTKHSVFSAQNEGTLNVTQGYLGKTAGIAGATNGKLRCNAAATTSVLRIVGLKPGSNWGTYAELLFVVAKSSFEGITS